MKEDEKRFLIELYQANKTKQVTPLEIILSPGFYIPYKRAWYILEKWDRRGLYDYGVTLRVGWLTDKGKALAKDLSEKVI